MEASKTQQTPSEEPQQLLEYLRASESKFQLKNNLGGYYFDPAEGVGGGQEQITFTSGRSDIYLKPGFKTQTELEGLAANDDIVLRRTYAAAIKIVGTTLQFPNETIILGQNIFQRFYIRFVSE